jgi:hypothetical protein
VSRLFPLSPGPASKICKERSIFSWTLLLTRLAHMFYSVKHLPIPHRRNTLKRPISWLCRWQKVTKHLITIGSQSQTLAEATAGDQNWTFDSGKKAGK